jgi:L-ascorbate metabolism protein UlaG (beta-lactamase superfamily)
LQIRKEVASMVRIAYLGHSAFHVKAEGLNALIDPFLSGNPKASAGKGEFAAVNYIFVTHGHGDHLGDTVEIAKRCDATVVTNFELCHYLAGKGVKCSPMHVGGRTRFPFGRVKLTPAWHGSGIEEGEKMLYGGTPCGFLIEVEGKKLYHAGDTGLTVEMQLLADDGIDVALLPIGGNFVMDVEDAAKAVKMIKPKMAIPMHYGTFPAIDADPEEFKRLVSGVCKVVILQPGEGLEF